MGEPPLISQTRGSTTSYFLQDGQGSTRALTNSSGVITDTYSYKAFGELFSQTGTTVNPYLYTGQQFDSLTSLYSLRARYYNPALGRFLSQDTYPVNFNNPVELNRYGYTANNPVNGMDPTGYSDTNEYGMTLQVFPTIGRPALTKIAYVSGAVILGYVIGLMLSQEGVNNPKTTNLEELREWIRRASQGWPEPPGENRPLWEIILRIVAAATLIGSLIPVAPAETETQEPLPEFIYRDGPAIPNRLRLYRPVDYETGLSFWVWDQSIIIPHIKFRVSTLQANGYVVIRDGDGKRNFTKLPFFGGGQPDSLPVPINVPLRHVTVYHHSAQYWQDWYKAELEIQIKYANVTKIPSPQTLALWNLREK